MLQMHKQQKPTTHPNNHETQGASVN